MRIDCEHQIGDGNCGCVARGLGKSVIGEVVVVVPGMVVCLGSGSVEACGHMAWLPWCACGSQVAWSSQDNWSSVAPMVVWGQVVDLGQASCLEGHCPCLVLGTSVVWVWCQVLHVVLDEQDER